MHAFGGLFSLFINFKYYVENGHPCIVCKSVWQEVQATWTDASRRNCTFSPIANKIICGDCGGRYGRKAWHSTTYRDAVWECNSKKAGRTKCKCRHMYAEELDTAIRRSMHHLLKTHKNIIPDCADLLSQATGEISSDARSVLNDIAHGKLDIILADFLFCPVFLPILSRLQHCVTLQTLYFVFDDMCFVVQVLRG